MEQHHLILVGPMGSGKSTVGRDLAGRMGRPHRDTDAAVVDQAGRSIVELFEDSGEADFRLRETAALVEILDGPPAVVSTGGGIVVAAENRQLLSEPRSVVVWLDAELDVLVRRVKSGRGRPLLDGDPRANLARKVAERADFYGEVADTKIDTTTLDRPATVQSVLAAFEKEVGS